MKIIFIVLSLISLSFANNYCTIRVYNPRSNTICTLEVDRSGNQVVHRLKKSLINQGFYLKLQKSNKLYFADKRDYININTNGKLILVTFRINTIDAEMMMDNVMNMVERY